MLRFGLIGFVVFICGWFAPGGFVVWISVVAVLFE